MEKLQLDVPKILEAPTTTEAKIVTRAASSGGTGEKLGIAIRGARYVCELPRGYTEHTQVCDFFGAIIAVHPGMPPLLIDGDTGRVREVNFARIQEEARRAKVH